ncbi:unnamed protein product [Acanthoscelides obtectus]|uniref:Uncharacterized protein n=1 Tax=Acanthoscelides obtectus TaxID=200917 RepID=A0A9P0M719_ACAOB|nr:unnamed protein product [Acanthoscelides obtectus]CAK1682770.1 hypothetical protein AOBTE_LOCUS33867 [Acanthoscelides obtectus]
MIKILLTTLCIAYLAIACEAKCKVPSVGVELDNNTIMSSSGSFWQMNIVWRPIPVTTRLKMLTYSSCHVNKTGTTHIFSTLSTRLGNWFTFLTTSI